MIRLATIDDVSKITNIHITSWIDTYTGIISANYLNNLSYIKRKTHWENIISDLNSEYTIFVAEFNNDIVGFVVFSKSKHLEIDGGEISAIYIKKEYTRKGIGTALCNHVFQIARKREYKNICFEVLAENSAVEFYKKIGCHIQKESHVKIDDTSYKTFLMVKDL